MHKKEIKCSFCLREEGEISEIIAGPDIYICDKCIKLCYNSIAKKEEEEDEESGGETQYDLKQFTPKKIVEFLNQYIVGQDRAKKVLSVIVYNHYKRIHHKDFLEYTDVEISKSNLMLIGPTGCGKTLFAQILAKILKVPYVKVSAAGLTQAGYAGEDPDSFLRRLFEEATQQFNEEKRKKGFINAKKEQKNEKGKIIALAEKGVVYIDEIDKIARRQCSNGAGSARDVSGEGVQQSLLTLVEGKMATIPSQNQGIIKPNAQEINQIDTSNILFICGGSFEDLDKIIHKRMCKTSIGFGGKVKSANKTEKDNTLQFVNPEDLVKYGFLPEFIGRFPIIETLDPLDEEALQKILLEPKNALIKQYQKMFKMDNIELTFDDEAISLIAQKALKRKTGARGLRSIMETVLLDFMFEYPGNENHANLAITKDIVEKKLIEHHEIIELTSFS